MPQYQENFENNPIHTEIQNFEQYLNTSSKIVSKIKDSGATEDFNRLSAVLDFIKHKLSIVDPMIVQLSVLNTLKNQIEQKVLPEVNNFNVNNNPAHLTTASHNCDPVLSTLTNLFVPLTPSDVNSWKDSITNFRRSAGQHLRNIESDVNDFKKGLSEISNILNSIKTETSSQKGRLDNLIDAQQTQFSDFLDKRRDLFENHLKNITEEYNSFKTKTVNDIDTSLSEQQNIVKNTTDTYEPLFKEKISSFEIEGEKLLNSINDNSVDTLDFLESQRDEAKKLLGIIGNIGVTGNYNEIADQDRKSANILRRIAIGLMVVGVLIIGFVVYEFTIAGGKFEWWKMLSRIALTGTVFIPAFYCANESKKHRLQEFKNRKMELELASIGPYLELLPKDERNKKKSELTDKFFGQSETPIDKRTFISPKDLYGLLEKILMRLTK